MDQYSLLVGNINYLHYNKHKGLSTTICIFSNQVQQQHSTEAMNLRFQQQTQSNNQETNTKFQYGKPPKKRVKTMGLQSTKISTNQLCVQQIFIEHLGASQHHQEHSWTSKDHQHKGQNLKLITKGKKIQDSPQDRVSHLKGLLTIETSFRRSHHSD